MARARNNRNFDSRMLSDIVTISRKFLRSVRLDADLGREDALSGYICQGTARALLESMALQIHETRQRAFTWTGPYGGGKSSLAVMLCSLVGQNSKLRSAAKKILGFPATSIVHKAFDAKGEGWLVVPLVGKRADVVTELGIAIAKARGRRDGRKRQIGVVGELVELAENHPQGVLVVIDELGKLLEASAQHGGDIYLFQELAEAASRCSGKLVIVGILHQAFDAYAARLGRQARDEWAKIQGRFIDIPLIAGADEVIELVGRAISVSSPASSEGASNAAEAIAATIRTRRPGTPTTLATSLRACWPLHPVTAALLGPISRRKFGQNERSTFGFLASREPLGFVEFLCGCSAASGLMYGPSDYWDYLRANLEPAIMASPDAHRWAQCSEAVERAEVKGTVDHVKLTKTIALIEMFRNGSGLVAEESVLGVSLPDVAQVQIRKLLEELADWRVLIERKHLGAWGIYAGSDFDIESAINVARSELGGLDFDHISTLTDLQPVLAKRLYQQTGTMRWFTKGIIRLEEVEHFIQSFKLKGASAGAFILCLPPIGQSVRSAETAIRKAAIKSEFEGLLLGAPRNADRIAELAFELSAAERVLKTRPELHGDSVARRELVGRIEAVRSSLEEELSDAFTLARWYRHAQVIEGRGRAVLSSVASDIASDVYCHAPHIFSELVNREELSSNSVKARKDLMYRMAIGAHRERLGYEGFPADAGLYYTVLNNSGLHCAREDGSWGFGDPSANPRGRSFDSLWVQTKSAVLGRGKTTSLLELYDMWRRPPFGVRAGVMPLLSLAFFLGHRSSLALYVDGIFTPDLNDAVVDEWTLDPSRIEFMHVEASRDQARLLEALARTFSERVDSNIAAAPLDVARGLVGLVISLPGWSKKTSTVSERAQQVRAMLLKANDPHKVLFADLPTLLDARDPDVLNERLRSVTDELAGAYDKMIVRVRGHLLAALDHRSRSAADLRERAAVVKGITGDFRLDAFAARLEQYDDARETVEGLISLAASKPPAQWVDRDIDVALTTMDGWAVDFRKAEAMAPLRGRPSTRRLIGVVFGARNGADATGYVEISDADTPSVDRLVQVFLDQSKGERREIILAALAEAGVLMVGQHSSGGDNG